MQTSKLVIVGAVLPLLLGASLGSLTTENGEGTWAYPMPAAAFLGLSLGLAVSHLLVALGYAAVARVHGGTASTPATVAAGGSVVLAACEVWSGLVARTDLDAAVLTALDGAYALSSLAVLAGTVGAGLVLRSARSPLAVPLLLNAAVLAVAMVLRFLVSDGWGIAALTVWSLTYVWLGLRLGERRRAEVPVDAA